MIVIIIIREWTIQTRTDMIQHKYSIQRPILIPIRVLLALA